MGSESGHEAPQRYCLLFLSVTEVKSHDSWIAVSTARKVQFANKMLFKHTPRSRGARDVF